MANKRTLPPPDDEPEVEPEEETEPLSIEDRVTNLERQLRQLVGHDHKLFK